MSKDYKLLLALLLILISCRNDKSNKLSANNNTKSSEKNIDNKISLRLVDSVDQTSKRFNFYKDFTRFYPYSPAIADSVYTYNDFNDIKKSKYNGKPGQVCYQYENGRYNKYIIAHDDDHIYGYNQSDGGELKFTLVNPVIPFDSFDRILYADSTVIYYLDDDLYRQSTSAHPNPTSDIIYKYDVRLKKTTQFYKTDPVSPYTGLFNIATFYITKISEDKYLFVTGSPSINLDKTIDIQAKAFLFRDNLDFSTLLLTKLNRGIYQIMEPYNKCVFELLNIGKIPPNGTSANVINTNPELEYFSIDIGNCNIRLLKGPTMFFNDRSIINDFGGLYFRKSPAGGGGYYVTKDFENFSLIPYRDYMTASSHILYIPEKHKYYYLELDNDSKGKMYIYEINNLPIDH